MATATTGLGRTAYGEAVKAAQNAKEIKNITDLLATYNDQVAGTVAMVRDLRAVHVNHLDTPNSEYISNAVSELDYRLTSLKRNVADYQRQLDRLEGNTPVADEED